MDAAGLADAEKKSQRVVLMWIPNIWVLEKILCSLYEVVWNSQKWSLGTKPSKMAKKFLFEFF